MIEKCSSPDGPFEPFYLIQSNNQEQRYVVSLNDKVHVQTILFGFINNSRLLQVKIRDLDNSETPIDYTGLEKRKTLHKKLEEFNDVLFSNGFFDFMIRNPKSGDYIVFDEHGLLFIYSNKEYGNLLEQVGAVHKADDKLIYEYDHWHRKEANSSERLLEFIKALKLKMD